MRKVIVIKEKLKFRLSARRGARGFARSCVALTALGLALGAGCADRQVTGPPPSQSTATPPLAAGAAAPLVASGDAADAGPSAIAAVSTPTWLDAVRMERWSDAAKAIDALPAAETTRPAMRYVRARAAIAIRDGERAVALLDGLEAQLPLLAEDVARHRADAQLIAGKYAESAAYFAKSKRADDLASAADALDRGGDRKQALALADRAVAAAQKAKQADAELRARSIRARIVEANGDKPRALVDLRWVAAKAPSSPEAAAARAALERLGVSLSAAERFALAQALTDDGSPAEALTLLAAVEGKPGVSQADLLHARARAIYKTRDWLAASKAYKKAATVASSRTIEQRYYAARSLLRCDGEDEALAIFRDLGKRYPKTIWGDRASYYAGRSLLMRGRFKEAAAEHDRYLARFPRGTSRDEATYERAIALLGAGDHKAARSALAKLAKGESRENLGRLRELEAVAALRVGDRDDAIAIWTDVATTLPLTWPALASRARLASIGAPLPPLIEGRAIAKSLPGLEVALPAPASLLASVGLDADAEKALWSNEDTATVRYEGRQKEALCAMYGMLSRAKRRYRIGVNAVGFDALMRAPSESEAWAWACVYPTPYETDVRAIEAERGIPKGLLHALMRQESAFDPAALSPVGAQGLMQLMPTTASRVAEEMQADYDPDGLTVPDRNLRFGGFYLGKLLDTWKGSVPLAAASYNAGPKAVSRWLESGAELDADLFVARIPYSETRHYVARVMGNLARYQWLEGGDAAVTELSLALPESARAPADAY